MTREERFKMDMIAEFKQICKLVEESGVIIQNKSRMIEALEQEPCEDFIDRADAMTEIMMFAGNEKNNDDIYIKVSDAVELLRELPPVTPQPKAGHWIKTNDYLTCAYGCIDYVKCSCCGEYSLEEGAYCPNCGEKMEDGKCYRPYIRK